MLGFALCFVCLAATTWAWFTVSVTSDSNTIQTASFGVAVTVTDGTTPVNAVDGVYTLNAGTAYTVTITKTGTASKGYCAVTIDGTDYYTQQITSNYTFTLNVTGTGTAGVAFTPSWGDAPAITTYSLREPVAVIVDGATIEIVGNGEETAEESAEDPADEDLTDENQQEEEQENQQQEEENPSDENNPADDSESNGEGESKPDTPTDGDGNEEQQGDEPSTPTDGEGEQQGGETTGGDISDDTATGGESPTGTTTPAGGDVPTDPAIATTPTAQSEGDAPADPAPIE